MESYAASITAQYFSLSSRLAPPLANTQHVLHILPNQNPITMTPSHAIRSDPLSAFRAAACVYLQSVIHGCDPDHPDVGVAVDRANQVLRSIPPSDSDRSLMWPLLVVGSVARRSMVINSYDETNDTSLSSDQRVYFATRFSLFAGKHGGYPHLVEKLVLDVWRLRDSSRRGELVDWRDVLGHRPFLLA